MQRVYVIGDVHGQLAQLLAAHERIERDRAQHGDRVSPVVHLGDYTDRGPDSFGVIQTLIEGMAAGQPWVCLKGNHDRMFRMFLDDPHVQDPIMRKEYFWLHERIGGRKTLQSYGFAGADSATPDELFAQRERIPPQHIAFLDGLKTTFETDDLFLCHAGIRPGIALADQSEDDLLWIRDDFHQDSRDHGRLIVHGHTPEIRPLHAGNRVNLDTGAGYDRPLTAAVFEGRDCWILAESGRQSLPSP